MRERETHKLERWRAGAAAFTAIEYNVLYRDQSNMLSFTLWPVFRFTSDSGGGGARYFCSSNLAFFNAVLLDNCTMNKYRIIHNIDF
jgi:hypothetical protein